MADGLNVQESVQKAAAGPSPWLTLDVWAVLLSLLLALLVRSGLLKNIPW